jgi:hypothetical protein
MVYAFYIWNAKVARFLAYIVDGGLLCSQFTLFTMIKMLEKVTDEADEIIIVNEIAYLLHIRKKGKPYDRNQDEKKMVDITTQFKDVMLDFNAY